MNRVLVIGLDGGTLDLIEPWVRDGQLPHLARLMGGGCCGRLLSTLQPITAPSWASFLTGVNQGKHGLYDFIRRQPGTYRLELTNATHIGCPTILDIAGQFDRKVAAVNVPMTFPPPRVNGIVIAGMPASTASRNLTHPPQLYDEIKRQFGEYVVATNYYPRQKDSLRAYVEGIGRNVENRLAVGKYLLTRYPWDLFVIVFSATDWVQHSFWHYMEDMEGHRFGSVILDVYRQVDAGIGHLLQDLEDNVTVIVMSDHGFGPLKKMVHINRWLSDQGFLYFKVGRATARKDLRSLPRQVRLGMIRTAMNGYKQWVPPSVRRRIRFALGKRFTSVRQGLESDLFFKAVDWPRTRAYSMGPGGNIFVNLQGREPQGCVHPDAYESMRSDVITRLERLTDPETGERIVRRVLRREDIYDGPYLELAPDLVVEWQDYSYWGRGRYDISSTPLFDSQFSWDFTDLRLSGNHTMHGVLIAKGKDIRPEAQIDGARIIDLAPTILHLLGLPVPAYMDGHVLADLFQSEPKPVMLEGGLEANSAATTLSPQPVYSHEEEEEVEARLKALGYL